MAYTSISTSPKQVSIQPELFRPPLSYPSYPYAEMLTRAAEHYPEHSAVVFKGVDLTYRMLESLVSSFASPLLDLGVGKGVRLCLFMTNPPDYEIDCSTVAF